MSFFMITGASAGIGLELAYLYGQKKRDLILVARSEDKLQKCQTDLKEKFGVKVVIFVADLSQRQQVKNLCLFITEKDLQVDILVNNAGVGRSGDFGRDSLEKNLEMMHLNMDALVSLTHKVLPQMRHRGKGHIINVASVAAFLPGPYMNVYYATKAFVLSFSEALREEVLSEGVNVSALCPGPVKTEFFNTSGMGESVRLEQLPFILSAKSVAEDAFNLTLSKKPFKVSGFSNKLLTVVIKFAPRLVTRKIVRNLNV